ncbi:MAG TPA: hypothetical protein VLE94_07805 [Burkholderiaceae bacterium]|nr:hypothetical protein [Burkholderiaceae bacterium]
MDAWQQAWHWVNLLLLPGALAAIHASICKLVWRRELARLSWLRLALWCAVAALAVDVAGWVWTGHEGSMLTYGAMVVALALTTWLMAFAPWRRRASA